MIEPLPLPADAGAIARTGPAALAGDLPELAARYLAAACSPATAATYRRHLVAFLRALAGAPVTADALIAYRATLVRDGRGAATHQQALAAVRGFLAWTADLAQALGQPHPIPSEALRRLLKAPRGRVERPYRVLTDREAAALLAHAPTPRDRAQLAVFLGAGLRVAELVGLDLADVQREGEASALWVRRGKGGTSRTVPIREDATALLAAYLAASGRTWASPGPLFLPLPRNGGRSSRSGRLTTRAVEYRIRQLAELAGVAPGKAISPHALRHTYAIRCLRAGGNLKALQELLGHASIETTERYLRHLQLAELRAAVPALPGFAGEVVKD